MTTADLSQLYVEVLHIDADPQALVSQIYVEVLRPNSDEVPPPSVRGQPLMMLSING
jgi:hypothetical protein